MGDGGLIISSCWLGLGIGKERWAGSGEERCAASGTRSFASLHYRPMLKSANRDKIGGACSSSIGLDGSHIRKVNEVLASGPALLAFSWSICASAASKECIRLWRPVARCSRWDIKVSRYQHTYNNTNSLKLIIRSNHVLFLTRLKNSMVHQVLLWVVLTKVEIKYRRVFKKMKSHVRIMVPNQKRFRMHHHFAHPCFQLLSSVFMIFICPGSLVATASPSPPIAITDISAKASLPASSSLAVLASLAPPPEWPPSQRVILAPRQVAR